jgi:phosphatidylserine/phosphatidylglycerophosphate/cardiolipin synthase-like enzyme
MSSFGLSAVSLRLIEQLSGRASLVAALFFALVRIEPGSLIGVRDLTALAGLSVSEEHGTEEVLDILAGHKLLSRSGARWLTGQGTQELMAELARVFNGIDHYLWHVHKDATEATVVLTRPVQSILLEAALADTGWRTFSTEHTEPAFADLVQRAVNRVVVMTPFLDERGAEWLRELVAPLNQNIQVVLILRSLEEPTRWDYPRGYPLLREWLAGRHAQVFNYSIPNGNFTARETFHAKVILADSSYAYVGSANVTAASRENSMEMGVIVKGHAALEIADVVDAVIKSAQCWPPNNIKDASPLSCF